MKQRRRHRTLLTGLALLAMVVPGSGCAVIDGARPPIQETDAAKYELEFLRCSPQTDAEYRASQSTPSIGGDTSRDVIAHYRITNLDTVRRRFDIRAQRVDSLGAEAPFLPQHSNRLDPGESSVEQLSMRQLDSDVAPYTCTADVWDSVIDVAFPDD